MQTSSRGSNARYRARRLASSSLICPQKSPSSNNLYQAKSAFEQQKIHQEQCAVLFIGVLEASFPKLSVRSFRPRSNDASFIVATKPRVDVEFSPFLSRTTANTFSSDKPTILFWVLRAFLSRIVTAESHCNFFPSSTFLVFLLQYRSTNTQKEQRSDKNFLSEFRTLHHNARPIVDHFLQTKAHSKN